MAKPLNVTVERAGRRWVVIAMHVGKPRADRSKPGVVTVPVHATCRVTRSKRRARSIARRQSGRVFD